MITNPTLTDALQHIEGLRGASLGKNGWRSWSLQLENWHPEQVIRAANKLAAEWMTSSPWPIGKLLAKLPPVSGERTEFEGFWWGIDGRHGGNWARFEGQTHEERAAIADNLLSFGQSEKQIELAERMSPGALARFVESQKPKKGDIAA